MALDFWAAWLEDDLAPEVHSLLRRHEVFRSWNEIVDVADPESKSNGLFHTWVIDNYAQALAVSVRRLCDDRQSTRSLVRLMRDMERRNGILTRDWWLARWSLGQPTTAYIEEFETMADSHGRIRRGAIAEDREALTEAWQRLKRYVDSHVAHLARNRAEVITPQFGDLHNAVRTVYRVFHKWYERIVNSSLAVPLAEPWEHVLAVRWITREQAAEIYQRRRKEEQALEEDLRQ